MNKLNYDQVHAMALECGAQTYGDLKDKPVKIYNSAIVACSADMMRFGDMYAEICTKELRQQRDKLC